MSSQTLYRLSGLALLLAALLQVAGWAIHPAGEELVDLRSTTQVPSHALMAASWLVLLVGLPGVYLRQAARAGRLGLAGYALLTMAVAFHVYLVTFEATVAPRLADDTATEAIIAPDGALAHGGEALAALGFLLVLAFPIFGIASLRAGVLPRWTGWLQVAAVPAFILAAILTEIGPLGVLKDQGVTTPIALLYYVVFTGLAGTGYALWRGALAGHAVRATARETQTGPVTA